MDRWVEGKRGGGRFASAEAKVWRVEGRVRKRGKAWGECRDEEVVVVVVEAWGGREGGRDALGGKSVVRGEGGVGMECKGERAGKEGGFAARVEEWLD